MAYLTPDSIETIHFKTTDLIIKRKIIPETARAIKTCASWCKKGQYMKPHALLSGNGRAKGIAVHNSVPITVNKATTMAEQYTRATWPNCNMGGVVVTYYVDPVYCWQNLEETEQGWHARDGARRHVAHEGASYRTIGGNLDCLSVEILGEESEDNGARLVAYLLHKHDLKITDVYTHNYFMCYQYGLAPKDDWIRQKDVKNCKRVDKNCPLYILDHWQDFLKKVEKYLHELKDAETSSPNVVQPEQAPQPNTPSKLYKVQIGSFSVKMNAEAYRLQAINEGYKTTFMAKTQVNGKTLYRVQLGAFKSRENAEAYAARARKDGFDVLILEE